MFSIITCLKRYASFSFIFPLVVHLFFRLSTRIGLIKQCLSRSACSKERSNLKMYCTSHRCYILEVILYGVRRDKTCLRFSDKAIFKPICSTTETSYKIENWLVTSLYMILSNKRISQVLIGLCECTGWSAPLLFTNQRRQVFSHQGPCPRNYPISFKVNAIFFEPVHENSNNVRPAKPQISLRIRIV